MDFACIQKTKGNGSLWLGLQVLLLDEITVDMDVVGRLDLLKFFEEEGRERGATIVYATHIFDGLEGWVSHLAYISVGKLLKGKIGKGAQSLAVPIHSLRYLCLAYSHATTLCTTLEL